MDSLPKKLASYIHDTGLRALDHLADSVPAPEDGAQPDALQSLLGHWRSMAPEQKEDFVTRVATSVGAVMKPAGLDAAKGVISVNYGKDPLDPTWKDDAGMKKYFEFMAKYYPDGDKDSSFNSYGYSTSQLMIYVLEKCGDNLTRENVMKVATSLKNVQLDLSLPGIVNTTTPDDYRVNKQLQMMKFNGERWELFGPILEDAGAAG